MRRPLSLKHKVIIPGGRAVDLQHTDLRATFARARREQEANKREREAKVAPMARKRA